MFFLSSPFTNVCIAREQKAGDEEVQRLSEKYRDRFESLELWLEYAPAPGRSQAERERKLKTIDEPLYLYDAPYFPCVGDFFRARMIAFMEGFLSADPGDDTYIWKLYSHTEVIQNRDISIVVDLIKGFGEVELEDATLERMVDNLDVLLITHVHGDHADERVVEMFLDRNKPVIVPELFWPDYPRNDELTVVRKGDINYPGARVYVFPSEQKLTVNSVYMIMTDNGHRIMHLGDNNNIFKVGHEWFRKFKKPLRIDLLVPNIWSPDLVSLLEHVRPELVMPSHEHELGHKPSGRRTYEYVYNVLRTIGEPYAVPAWGERIVLKGKPGPGYD